MDSFDAGPSVVNTANTVAFFIFFGSFVALASAKKKFRIYDRVSPSLYKDCKSFFLARSQTFIMWDYCLEMAVYVCIYDILYIYIHINVACCLAWRIRFGPKTSNYQNAILPFATSLNEDYLNCKPFTNKLFSLCFGYT